MFLYTDGVNESENRAGEQFGTEALENRLQENIGMMSDVSDEILQTIEAFSDGAVQSDDITILTLRVNREPSHSEITVMNQVDNLTKLNLMITRKRDISDDIKAQLMLIAEELFVNICSYAYGGKEGSVTIAMDIDDENVTLTFSDSGQRRRTGAFHGVRAERRVFLLLSERKEYPENQKTYSINPKTVKMLLSGTLKGAVKMKAFLLCFFTAPFLLYFRCSRFDMIVPQQRKTKIITK